MAAPADIGVTILHESAAGSLAPCLGSLHAAQGRFRLDVTIVAHGIRPARLHRVARDLAALDLPGRVFHIPHADTANALNQAMGALRQPARLNVFVAGGAQIAPDTLSGFAALLSRHPEALAATGLPARDPAAAAETLREGGRLHAPLFALRPAFLDRLAAAGLRLPVGLCCPHWLLARMACHDLDIRQHRWDARRIAGAAEAVFRVKPQRLAQTQQRMRVFMEMAALSGLIARDGFAALPNHTDTLLRAWLNDGNTVPATRRERFFLHNAIRRLGKSQEPTPASLQPALVFATTKQA
jgi:hypothetical protein